MEFLIRNKNGQFYSSGEWVEYEQAEVLDTSSPRDQQILRKHLGGEYQIVENIRFYC